MSIFSRCRKLTQDDYRSLSFLESPLSIESIAQKIAISERALKKRLKGLEPEFISFSVDDTETPYWYMVDILAYLNLFHEKPVKNRSCFISPAGRTRNYGDILSLKISRDQEKLFKVLNR